MDQAERLRTLIKDKTDSKTGCKIIAVTSGKGGAGKTGIALNMAINFSRMGKKVIILDTDFGLSNIEVMFGIYPQYTISDFLFKGKKLSEVITKGYENVGFISGGSAIVKLLNVDSHERMLILNRIKELEEACDILMIDTGAGISDAVVDFLIPSNEIVLITTPEPTSITDAYALVKTLSINENYNKDNADIKVLCNKANSEKEGNLIYEKLNSVTGRFLKIKLSYLGYIPYDNHIPKAIMKQVPVTIEYPESLASRSYKRVAQRLSGEVKESQNNNRMEILFSKYFMTKRGY